MTPAEVAQIRQRREAGETLALIAGDFDVSRERIRQLTADVHPRRNCRGCGEALPLTLHRARLYCTDECRPTYKEPGECRECGAATAPQSKRCLECDLADRARAKSHRTEVIERMWNDGATLKEIAAELDTTVNALGPEFVRLRRNGVDLPYRRKPVGRNEPLTKRQCNQQLIDAVANGVIRRPARCERCGETKHVDGHHHDYSRPLYVEWLCRSCHAATHVAERKAA